MITVESQSQSSLYNRRLPLAMFILTSVLVHGAGLLVLMFLERSPSVTKQEIESNPIEFVVVPPEAATEEPPPETQRQAANNSVARGKVEPKTPTATNNLGEESTSKPSLPPKTESSPPQPKTSPTTPQPATPPQTQHNTAVPSKSTQPPAKITKPEKPLVTAKEPLPPETSLPEQTVPEPTKPNPDLSNESTPQVSRSETSANIVPSQPVPSNSESSGAAGLLGGSYQRSLADDGGDSFFNPEAIASRAADNPQGLDARQNLDLAPYLEEIRRRVKRNWNPSVSRDERHAVLTFSIQKNGQITGLKVARTSGSEVVDRESLEAVRRSAPFNALPASYPLNALDIEFNFNIYIYR